MMKRLICLLLAAAMTAGMLPLQILAEELQEPAAQTAAPAEETQPAEETAPPETTEETAPPETTEETAPPETSEETAPPEPTEETAPSEPTEEPVPDPTEEPEEEPQLMEWSFFEDGEDYAEEVLLTDYFQREMLGGGIGGYGLAVGEFLEGDIRKVYDALVPILRDIADGKRTSSVVVLGSYSVWDYTPDVKMTIDTKAVINDLKQVMEALRYDYSYLMYWFDVYGKNVKLWYTSGSIMFIFNIGQEYRSSTATVINETEYYTTVNINKTHVPQKAAATVRQLVEENAGKTDYDKLQAYAKWISDEVSYDHYAADNDTASYDGDPWQIIHTFDGDPETNVVCEGYAKSMQLLCDLSAFEAEIECYCVTGVGHMWNILRIDDESYLVDVTGYDKDQPNSYSSSYFLAGGVPDSQGGYQFGTMYYAYYEETIALWAKTDVLTLADCYYSSKLAPDIPVAVQLLVDGVAVSGQSFELISGTQLQLNAEVSPKTASQSVRWHSNNSSVAAIDDNGLVTAVGEGTTSVFAIAAEYSELYNAVRIIVKPDSNHLVHTPVLRNVLEATCTLEGYTGDMVCSECGQVTEKGSAIPPLDHFIVVIGQQQATCTWEGYTGDKQCLRCQDANETGQVIPKLDHTPELVGKLDATCTADGYTGDTKCTVCQEIYVQGSVIPKLDHIPELVGKLDATCTSDGYTGDAKCTVCQEVYVQGSVIPALDHIPELVGKLDATCTADGYTGDTECTVCQTICQQGSVIPAWGHSYETMGQLQPTCTQDGHTGGRVCTICRESDLSGEVIPALGHTPVQITVPKKSATTTEYGHSSFQVLSCTRCGRWLREDLTEMTDEQAEQLKLDHVVYASAKSLTIRCQDGTAVPKTINGNNYPEKLQLKAVVAPGTAEQKVTWSTSSKSIASVDKDGLVTFKANGKVTITAKTANKKTASVTMTVTTKAESMEIIGAEVVYAAQTLKLKAAIAPAAAKDTVKWYLPKADQKYASISSKGILTPKKSAIPEDGVIVEVIAKAQDGSGVDASHFVIIWPAVSSVSVTADAENSTYDLTLDEGDVKLSAEVSPYMALEKVKWRVVSGSASIVKSDDTTCLLRPTKNGTVTVRAAAADGSGKYRDYRLKVITSVEQMTLKESVSVTAGQKLTLKPGFKPSSASNQKYTWSSDGLPAGVTFKDGVVTVSKKLKEGTSFTVTATSADKNAVNPTVSCLVEVHPLATKVELTREDDLVTGKTLSCTTDEKLQLEAVVSPLEEYGASQAVKWSTSSSKIAAVTQQGLVTFKAPGTVTITATARDGSKKYGSVKIRVRQLVTELKLPEAPVVGSGRSLTLKATAYPSNAADRSYTWLEPEDLPDGVSFENGVVTVSADWTGVESFAVKAVSNDGGNVVGECTVTVYPAAAKVTLTRSGAPITAKSLSGKKGKTLQLGAMVLPDGEGGACQQVKWSTSSSKIATVSSSGLVKFKKAGTVTITATAIDGTKVKASIKIVVK